MQFRDWFGKKYVAPKNKVFPWRPSVFGLIMKSDRILLVKSRVHGLWELPGGEINVDETIVEALHRETREETGYTITITNKQPVYTEDNFFYIPDLNKYCHAIPLILRARPKGNNRGVKPTHIKETAEAKWFDLKKLPKPMNPMAIRAIKYYKKTTK